MKPIIHATGVSKKYRLGAREARYVTLRDKVVETFTAPLRWLRPSTRPAAETLWALRDVSFDVAPGEAVGIIGRNGAGKSTLLKVLSRITEPTTGCIDLYGRVASLLEVGTGFHPELTGRENVYLSGAVLGMKRREIDRKFDEIVAFSEMDQFLDTPMKRYSSGMQMRLAFAVAAHLDPEIFIIDEVLAVGDAAFQKKCLGRMERVASQGRTVLFVSHNMPLVRQLCTRGILLSQGRIAHSGPIHDVVHEYLKDISLHAEVILPARPERRAYFTRFCLRDARGNQTTRIPHSEPFVTEIEYVVQQTLTNDKLCWQVARAEGIEVMGSVETDSALPMPASRPPGKYVASVHFPGGILNEGIYQYRVALGSGMGDFVDYQYGNHFEVYDDTDYTGRTGGRRNGVVLHRLEWEERPVV